MVTEGVQPPRRADWRWLRRSAWHLWAYWWGCGLWPWGPGTAGTVGGWLVFAALSAWISPAMWLLLCTLLWVPSVMACSRSSADLGVADPGGIVIDEVLAFWCLLALLPYGLPSNPQLGQLIGQDFALAQLSQFVTTAPPHLNFTWQLIAFGLFRVLDATKPPPIRWFDEHVHGGWGIMIDDLVAALVAGLVLLTAAHVFPVLS